MAKNLMYEICKMLGVELFEEFKVVHKTGFEIICNFTKEGLFVHKGYSGKYEKELLADIICGKVEIVKLPRKPNKGDVYFTLWLKKKLQRPAPAAKLLALSRISGGLRCESQMVR